MPFIYDDGKGCSTVADTSDATLEAMYEHLYQQNPLASVSIVVRDPVVAQEVSEWLTDPLMDLVSLRFEDGADANTYYYGLIDTCAPDDFVSATGLAFGIPSDPTSPSAAADRTAVGRWIGLEGTAQIFVHEMGHCMGRAHISCEVPAGGSDPS